MPDTHGLITVIYAAFNRRDIDGVFAHFSEQVSWPTASEDGRVIGKNKIRAYWTRQWAEFDPRVEPVAMDDQDGVVDLTVHQVVKTPTGELLSDQHLVHTYTVADGLIERMDIGASEPAFGAAHSV